MSTERPLVLIEPYAHRAGGHHQRTLAALAETRPGSVVIAPHGAWDLIPLRDAAARLVTGAAGPAARVLLAAATGAGHVAAVARRVFAARRWPRVLRRFPHQVTLIQRCLTEAACLRTARRLVPDPAAVVVLSASEALHGAAAWLGGPHLRYVHETVTSEDLPVRLLGRLARRGERRVVALYPTAAIRDQLADAFPRLPGTVRPFAVDDGRRLTEAERDGARCAFDIPAGAAVVCLVGGWWPYKDIAAVGAALQLVKEPLHLVVAGAPLDEGILGGWRELPSVQVHTVPGPVGEAVLRLVYAAADVALVARHRGVAKESGLVMDALRLGVPLIVSDHDPDLTARLTGRPWARLFPAGDAAALAAALDHLAARPPDRPGSKAPRVLGMFPAAEQTAYLTDTYAHLAKELEK